jgi:hypothetical protein
LPELLIFVEIKRGVFLNKKAALFWFSDLCKIKRTRLDIYGRHFRDNRTNRTNYPAQPFSIDFRAARSPTNNLKNMSPQQRFEI